MQVVPVCQINYKITSADTALLEDQFVLQWPVAEEGEHHPVLFWGGERRCSLFIGEQCPCAGMMLYLPAFVLHLLSNSPAIFMLIAEVISGNGNRLLICLDTSCPCVKATSCKCVETFPRPFSFGKAFYLLLQVGAMRSSSACCLHESSGVTRTAAHLQHHQPGSGPNC